MIDVDAGSLVDERNEALSLRSLRKITQFNANAKQTSKHVAAQTGARWRSALAAHG
jgi:hypothetical protein